MDHKLSLLQLTPEATIQEITSAGTYSADLLASIGLDPKKYRHQTLRSVCRQMKWSEHEVLKWLKQKDQASTTRNRADIEVYEGLDEASLPTLCDYLVQHFHQHNRALLGETITSLEQVEFNCNMPYKHKESSLIAPLFYSMEETVMLYLKFEEQKFIPLAQKLTGDTSKLLDGTFRKLRKGFDIIERDQKRIQQLMKKILKKASIFQNPGDAISSVRTVTKNTKLLFSSLNQQFDFEKNVLLPEIKNFITSR